MKVEFKQINWLSDKYTALFGLRSWNWQRIIDGIIEEHLAVLQDDSSLNKKVDKNQIKLLWLTFLEIAGIENLREVPNTRESSSDVKVAMYMYSMESFLYKRINKVSIDRFTPSVKNLGPFSVLISRTIERS